MLFDAPSSISLFLLLTFSLFFALRFVPQTIVMAHNVRNDSVSRGINDETFLEAFFMTSYVFYFLLIISLLLTNGNKKLAD